MVARCVTNIWGWLLADRIPAREELPSFLGRLGFHPEGSSSLRETSPLMLATAQHASDVPAECSLPTVSGYVTEAISPQCDEIASTQAIARRYRCQFVDLDVLQLSQKLIAKIPADLMFRYNFVPIEEATQGRLTIAVADPSRLTIIDQISLILRRPLVIRVATRTQIAAVLKKSEQARRLLREASVGFAPDPVQEETIADEDISMHCLTLDGSLSPVIRLISTVIFTALQLRASDIHFETQDDTVRISLRIDGVLTEPVPPIAKKYHSSIISRIKVMSELDISERRVPQDGRFRVKYGIPERAVDFRVSIIPAMNGENAVLRVLDKESVSENFGRLTLDVLGFCDDTLQTFRRYIREPYGMVLVTGPTGSGKTTTLYAAISEIKSTEDKFVTIEDPIEYQIPGIMQIPVNERKGLTFARGLRSILRHDPDKIMVGEIRDTETAQIAIQSALTGHLVFTTVHANNVLDVIGRFLNMGVEPYNFVSALNCILAQRLVRLICKSCRAEVHYDAETLIASGLDPEQWLRVPFFEGRGCVECAGTGFRGRTAIHELLDLTDQIRDMILLKKPISEIRRVAWEQGIQSLREGALQKVKSGLTTLREINKVTSIDCINSMKPGRWASSTAELWKAHRTESKEPNNATAAKFVLLRSI